MSIKTILQPERTKLNPIIIGIIILTIIAIGGIAIAATLNTNEPVALSYSKSDTEKPQMAISERDFDFGKIKLSDIATKEITVSNIGTKPLTLSDFTTSCGCTTIQLIYDDKKSQQFSLHQKRAWQKDIAVGGKAIIKIKYEPKAMPVTGEVKRTAFFKTNDPNNTDVQINFKVFVEK